MSGPTWDHDTTTHDNTTTHDGDASSSDNDPSTSSHHYAASPSDPDDRHHLGNLEGIPFFHSGTVRIVRHARVAFNDYGWLVLN
ncbi:unnamed protein product [Fusarium langsethiae]|nr:unnamed protein product [Fusarium langsethiae]GKU17429.1 unnamed protein product [Fusarium langsethiae]